MSVLLETSLGDIVIDLDYQGSPLLVENFLKLVQARYYTQTLVHQVVPGRFLATGDPTGTGTGGACAKALEEAYGTDDVVDDAKALEQVLAASPHRFLASQGRRLTAAECQQPGRVVAVEFNGLEHTVGSQFWITLEGQALQDYKNTVDNHPGWLSLGQVVEDEHKVLDQINRASRFQVDERPTADIRIKRALIVYNPLPANILWSKEFLQKRGVVMDDHDERVVRSPSPERPPAERVEPRIPWETVMMPQSNNKDDDEPDPETLRRQLRAAADADRRHHDASRARVLEMLGDLPDAEATAPKNVLFVAKLNPLTTDEDLQLIFSRFDPNVRVDIIRDRDTGQSLQYAFCAFTTETQAVEAYFKMNQALVDDRRILVDFSQSVAHVWDKYRQQYRDMPKASWLAPPPTRGGDHHRRRRRGPDNNRGRDHRGRPERPQGDTTNRHHPGGRREYSHDSRDRHGRTEERHPQAPHRHHHQRSTEEERSARRDRDNASGEERHRRDREEDRYGERRRERSYDDSGNESRSRSRRREDDEEDDRRRKHSQKRYDSDDSREDRKHRRKEKHRRRYDSDQDSEDARRRKKRRHKRHRSERDDDRRERKHKSRDRHDDDREHRSRREEDYHSRGSESRHRRRKMDSDDEDHSSSRHRRH